MVLVRMTVSHNIPYSIIFAIFSDYIWEILYDFDMALPEPTPSEPKLIQDAGNKKNAGAAVGGTGGNALNFITSQYLFIWSEKAKELRKYLIFVFR